MNKFREDEWWADEHYMFTCPRCKNKLKKIGEFIEPEYSCLDGIYLKCESCQLIYGYRMLGNRFVLLANFNIYKSN